MGRHRNWPPRLLQKPGTAEARTYYGRWHHCGKWDVVKGEATPAARAKHAVLLARWAADPGSAARPADELLLGELLADWRESSDGPKTPYARQMLRLAGQDLGERLDLPAAAFGPADLLAWQDGLGKRLAANTVRPMRSAVLRAFGWAEDTGRVPEGHAARLDRAVGRRPTPGRPMKPRPPAVEEHVAACLAVLDGRYPGVAALVRVHALVGSRVEELLELRVEDVRKAGHLVTPRGARLDLTGEKVWAAVCERHKMQKEKDRVLVFGPQARKLLGPLLKCSGPLFDLQSGRTDAYRRGGTSLKARLNAYWRAVRYACRIAGVPSWTPRQLRQAVADRVRDALTGEHAGAYLGHGPKGVTERHYLTTALKKAAEAARAVG